MASKIPASSTPYDRLNSPEPRKNLFQKIGAKIIQQLRPVPPYSLSVNQAVNRPLLNIQELSLTITSIMTDITFNILKHLRPVDLVRYGQVCKQTQRISQNSAFWELFMERIYPNVQFRYMGKPKDVFKQNFIMQTKQLNSKLYSNLLNENYSIKSVKDSELKKPYHYLTYQNDTVIYDTNKNSIELWDIKTNELKHVFEGHSGKITCLCLNGNTLISAGSNDNTIKIWDLQTYQLIATLKGHKGRIDKLEVLGHQNQLLASTSYVLGTTILWDIKEEGKFMKIREFSKKDGHLLLSIGDHVVTYSDDSGMNLYNFKTRQYDNQSQNHYTTQSQLVRSYNNDTLVFPSRAQGQLTTMNINTRETMQLNPGIPQNLISMMKNPQDIKSMLMLPNGKVAVGYVNKLIRIFDLKAYTCIHTFKMDEELHSLHLKNDDKLIATDTNGNMRVYDLNNNTTIDLKLNTDDNLISYNPILKIKFIGEHILITNDTYEVIRVWNLETKKYIKIEIPDIQICKCLYLDSGYIILAGKDYKISILDFTL